MNPPLPEHLVIAALAALAQPHRLQAFRALVVAGPTGLTPAALALQLGLPGATLSFHLKALLHAQLVSQERSGRQLIYRAEFDHIRQVLAHLTDQCCQGQPCEATAQAPLNVLFLCTHNSARSILAEALLNHLGRGRFRAYSAGSSPRPQQQPHPLGLAALQAAGIETAGLHSKSWDAFAKPDAPRMDVVITVCDSAAGEVCPFWPGAPATAHWGYADPSAVPGGDAARQAAFDQTLQRMSQRLQMWVNLPPGKLQPAALQQTARALAQEAV